jgi:predicted metal-dependent peptidase
LVSLFYYLFTAKTNGLVQYLQGLQNEKVNLCIVPVDTCGSHGCWWK